MFPFAKNNRRTLSVITISQRFSILYKMCDLNVNCAEPAMALVKPNRRLASNTLKQALRAFVVPVVSERYNVVALRVLWKVENNHIWKANEQVAPKRKQLETLLDKKRGGDTFYKLHYGARKRKLSCSDKKRKRSKDSDSEEKNVPSEGKPDLNPKCI